MLVLFIGSVSLIILASNSIFLDWLTPYLNGSNITTIIAGLVSFLASLFLKLPSDRKHYFFKTLLISILFALCFSIFNIMAEFDPNNNSKGWGILFFIASLFGSMIGTELGLRIGSFIRKGSPKQ